jgi:hypothetical protein
LESDNPALLILWHKNWEVLVGEPWGETGDTAGSAELNKQNPVSSSTSHAISNHHFVITTRI